MTPGGNQVIQYCEAEKPRGLWPEPLTGPAWPAPRSISPLGGRWNWGTWGQSLSTVSMTGRVRHSVSLGLREKSPWEVCEGSLTDVSV